MNLMSITFSSPPPGTYTELRPNKKISVFQVTRLKILGSVSTHIFVILFYAKNIYNFMHFERHLAFQNG